MNERRLSPNQLALKAAFRDLVKAVGGGSRAETLTRVNATLLSKYGAAHESVFAPNDVVSDLEEDCGDPIVTRVLAQLRGYDLIPIGTVVANEEGFIKHAADISRTHGDVASSLLVALADGRGVDPKEAAQIIPAVRASVTQKMELLSDLERVATSNITSLKRSGS